MRTLQKLFNIKDAAGFKKQWFAAFVVIIIEYFCNSPCADYFHAYSTILTARVLSKIAKIVTSLFSAGDTNICGENEVHSSVSHATL